MKTIIQVWTHSCINTEGFWGLGDMIRGTCFLYEYCKKHNYQFILDIQLHGISNYLIHSPHEYSDIILKNKDNIFFVNIDSDISKYTQNNINYFFTNASIYTYENINEDTKEFIKNIFKPNEKFSKYLSEYLTLPFFQNKYSVLHYRLGDKYNENVEPYLKNIKNNIEENQIFISDSNELKYIVKNNTKLFMLDIEPGHIGINLNVKNDLIEYFILMKCDKIKTYSNYSWISGFVHSINKIYNIQLINIKYQIV